MAAHLAAVHDVDHALTAQVLVSCCTGVNETLELRRRGGRIEAAHEASPPQAPVPTEVATFAAGCFWGFEATFMRVPGVIATTVGYTGGNLKNPTDQDVGTDTTGHTEAVRVEFDPSKVTYAQLLANFFVCHDPTTLNRQGPDVGTQYRSAVFFHTPEQEKQARADGAALQRAGEFKRPIVTQILPAKKFCPTEEYHQTYLQKRGQTTCKP